MPRKSRLSSEARVKKRRQKAKTKNKSTDTFVAAASIPSSPDESLPTADVSILQTNPQMTSTQLQRPTHSDLSAWIEIPDSFSTILQHDHWLLDHEIWAFFKKCIGNVSSRSCIISPTALSIIQGNNHHLAHSLIEHILYEVNDNWQYVYLPYNRNNNHWLLYIADRRKQKILFIDPKKGKRDSVAEHTVRSALSHILGDDMNTFSIQKVTSICQQIDGNSCGAWICQWGYLHSQNIPFSRYRATDCEVRSNITSLYDGILVATVLPQQTTRAQRGIRKNVPFVKQPNKVTFQNENVSAAVTVRADRPERTDLNSQTTSVSKIHDVRLHECIQNFNTEIHNVCSNVKVCTVCDEGFPGIIFEYSNDTMCRRCKLDKVSPKLYSFNNDCNPGPQPEELQNLTVVEQMLIAAIMPSCCIYNVTGGQRAVKGHVISFPQHLPSVATSLPRTSLPILLLEKSIKGHPQLLRVRRERISNALSWLVINNKFFSSISIDRAVLDELPEDGPYGNVQLLDQENSDEHDVVEVLPILESSTLLDLPFNEMESAFRERLLLEKLQWPSTDTEHPINEFDQLGFFSLAFPHLFPTGAADYNSTSRPRSISIGDYVKHLIKYNDPRFRRDERFSFFAMNVVFRWRALASGRVYIKSNKSDAKKSANEIFELMKEKGFLKKVLAYSTTLHGSAAYWREQCKRVQAMCEQIGKPTFFVTLSAADLYWPDLLQLFQCTDVTEMPGHLRNDPAIADWYFTHRFQVFLKHFFCDYMGAREYFFRVEYQHRGSPHVHGLLWMPDAPNTDFHESVNLCEVANYVDTYISTCNPRSDTECVLTAALYGTIHPCRLRYDDVTDVCTDYNDLVNACMRHTKCMQGRCLTSVKVANDQTVLKCRFNFPKALVEKTVCEWVKLKSSDTDSDMRLVVHSKRNDSLVNSHLPSLLIAWRANVECQLIASTVALREYLLKYLTKGESSSDYLKRIREMASNSHSSNNAALRAIQGVLLATVASRDFSAQECCHHILQLPLYFSSRTFVTLNTSAMRSINSDGEECNNLDKYKQRPEELQHMCLIEFMRKFSFHGKKPALRRKEVVVIVKPFYCQNSTKPDVREWYYEQQLMLHVPWRDVDCLKANFATWKEAYEANCLNGTLATPNLDLHVSTKNMYTTAESAGDAPPMEIAPYHLGSYETIHPVAPNEEQENWMQVVEEPGRVYQEMESVHDVNIYRSCRQDPEFNWSLSATVWDITAAKDFLTIHKAAVANNENDTLHVNRNELNAEQMAVFDAVLQRSNNNEPLLGIVLGSAGTGKSHLIHAIKNELRSRCFILAPTGVAACNIGGHTIHSALAIPVKDFSPLGKDSLMQLQERWTNVTHVIVDEISMVGQRLMGMVDCRLREIFPQHREQVFGGRSVLLFGDFAQLSPVKDKSLFAEAPKKAKTTDLAIQGRMAYMQIQRAFLLTTIVRQADDNEFRSLLQNLRNAQISREDWQLLCSRDDVMGIPVREERFQRAMRLFPRKDQVFRHNLRQLESSGDVCAIFHAIHPARNDKGLSKAAESDEAGGLESVLALCVGAQVMLVHNLWIEKGLVNGSVGTVKGIFYEQGQRPPQLPECVFVHFPQYTGPCMQPDDVVPITPRTFHWHVRNVQCARTQLPLTLAWACTIHKSQGLTLDCAVVDLGQKETSMGLSYVALSRVRRLQDLCVYPLSLRRLEAVKRCSLLQSRLKEEKRLSKMTGSN